MTDTANPASDIWPTFLRLLRLLRPHYRMIAVGLFFLLLAAPCELFPGLLWKYVTDDIVLQTNASPWMTRWFSFNGLIDPSHRFAMLASATIWLFIVYAVGETFETLEGWLLNRVALRFMLNFRNRVYRKLQSQSLSYLTNQRSGDLMSRAMGDVDELQSFIVNSIDVIISEGLLWIVTIFILMNADWRVTVASLSPLILVFVLLRFFNRRIQPIYKAARERLGDVSTRLQENLSGVVVIKIFGREKQKAQRFEGATNEYFQKQNEANNARNLFFPFSRAVGFLSNVAMIGVGGFFMIKDGSFTPGKLVMFRAYWYRLFGPVQTLARVNDMVMRAIAAARRVFEVLDAPDELPDAVDAKVLTKIQGNLELQQVSFAYDPRSVGVPPTTQPQDRGRDAHATGIVLRNITLNIPAGKTVALCGPSGSGKSTILNLLLRFYDPTQGVVTLDGIDLRTIKKESLRSHFALVQQESFLFNDSILDNIRYGHAEATMDQVIAAASAANAHEFIAKLANGYDTKVGERGVRLSGGQKQRVSIARAFLANPSILLLDEPTSSVEPDSEAAIITALNRLMKGRTAVLTSHRPSLINQAELVYVIEDGRISESGTIEGLRKGDGWFSRFMRTGEESTPSPTSTWERE
jgi:ABC-type multidrug transport system fused ATPase/permease subunit